MTAKAALCVITNCVAVAIMANQAFVDVSAYIHVLLEAESFFALTFITCWRSTLFIRWARSIVAVTLPTSFPVAMIANFARAHVASLSI